MVGCETLQSFFPKANDSDWSSAIVSYDEAKLLTDLEFSNYFQLIWKLFDFIVN